MIYVVRHGQTDLNKEGRLQGRFGESLNEVGIKQAILLRERLGHISFDHVFSSPQERAVQTAELISKKDAIKDARLDVFDLGEADRLKKEEVKMHGPLPDSNVYKGIEDISTFLHRVFNFMKDLESEYCGQEVNILIAGHLCTTGCMGAFFNGIPEDKNILRFSSNNGEYNVYDFSKAK
ncbi:histidine phosphatase family protein [Bacillus suaedaesalsae]|uniref:Histidine phosphatase family protein n=1 Tax=Bacillus suaedaesalsae TaxID=2810349 RepID=A0ABS2DKI8_9BACI|nr:histidine phosphatase family protein [Bacillus suaedaesalsae]MBM6617983.1 histidine phosphatase family protein [Bacillus suaedaesalsae]